MSHFVEVTDPWFGSYFRIILGGTWPTFYMGPRATTPLRMETIRNLGCLVENDGIREKNVEHTYVDGTISGRGLGATSFPVLPCSGGSFTKTRVYGNNKYEWQVTARVSPTTVSVVRLDVEIWYQEYYKDKPLWAVPRYGYFTASISVETDSLTGTVTYSAITKTGSGGYCPANGGVGFTANPYGGGGSGLGNSLTTLMGAVEGMFARVPRDSPGYKELRDEAIGRALENTTVADLNPLTDFKDLAHPTGLATQLARNFKGPGVLGRLKTIANMHLFWKYVVQTNMLTARECLSLKKYLQGGAVHAFNVVASRDVVGRGTVRRTWSTEYGSRTLIVSAKVVYGSGFSPFAGVAKLRRLGLLPGIGDVWDMVPYSFVVDWVIPIQSKLDRADALMDTLHLPLKYLVLSTKVIDSIEHLFGDSDRQYTVKVSKTRYFRRVMFTLPRDTGLGSFTFSNPLKHGLTLTSLIVQRLKKS